MMSQDAILASTRERALAQFCQLMQALNSAPQSWLATELTFAQLKALLYLAAQGRASGRELARALGVGPPAVSQLVDRLVAHGHVQRAEDPADRRITWLSLTDQGRATVERLLLDRRERFAAVLDALPPEELERVAEALAVLAAVAQAVHGCERRDRC
ncbi:MAG: MarR family transcriptional regulator [Chloroflexi bacterium]|nr:MarR family transcriptional regulator [Chloroflexota bacterium]